MRRYRASCRTYNLRDEQGQHVRTVTSVTIKGGSVPHQVTLSERMPDRAAVALAVRMAKDEGLIPEYATVQ